MSYDLIACDVDGTLFSLDEQLTVAHAQLRDYIQKKNLPFTLISGRSWPGLKPVADFLNIQLPLVANNGATAYCKDGSILWSHEMKKMWVEEAIYLADNMEMAIIFTDGKQEYAYRKNDYIQNQMDRFGRYKNHWMPTEEEWSRIRLVKLLIIDPQRPGAIDRIIDVLHPYEKYLNCVRYNSRSVDIMSSLADKCHGVLELKESLNSKKVLAFGDDLNDIHFLQAADCGVAVQNAHADLKSVADLVSRGQHVLGVMEVLKEVYGE